MRSRQFLVLLAAISALTLRPAPALPSPQNPNASAPAQAPAASAPIKAQTRVITIDVVVTDSHGAPVRGLKKENFHIFEEHNREQQIAGFEFVDHSANPASSAPATPSPSVFTNDLIARLSVPPTVLLMDSLNTELDSQMQSRKHMVAVLKTLPAGTPVAVFSLGHLLRVVQGFSTDPKVLQSAVDKLIRGIPIEQNPQDDANSASAMAVEQNGGKESFATRALEDFEREEYEGEMSLRVDETTEAMVQIAKYLTGYPGRKNLIWFSGSFPIKLDPATDFGSDPFMGSASYADKVRAAAQALADARVAVYPVDANGLDVARLYSTTQNPRMNRMNPGASMGATLGREDVARNDQHATMDDIADSTGGRTCKNTNDLSGCVQAALNDAEVYYTLAYYPQGIAWDGKFHKISVKTDQHGVRLDYRRGYIATEGPAFAPGQKPEELLARTCQDPLPSTSISMKVEPVATQGNEKEGKYLLTVSPRTLTLDPAGGTRRLSLQMAICEYDAKGEKFQYMGRDLSRPVTDAVYQDWRQHGIQNIFDYDAKPEDTRLRFVVVDVPSGATGSVDVPAHPQHFTVLPAQATPAGATAAATPSSTAPAPRDVVTSLRFASNSGKSGTLDWKEGTLFYRGDLDVAAGARGFFQKFYGSQYHCQSGNLVANDSASTDAPKLVLVLESAKGTAVAIDMAGNDVKYSGSLTADAAAKEFFDDVRKLCHCQQP